MNAEAALTGARWNFEDFELDVAGFQLLRQSRPVKIERIPMELLILLVERSGQLVSREEIAARLWGDGVYMDAESGVNTAVRKLRAALKDSPEQPVFIETVAGKGYRFIGPVSKAGGAAAAEVVADRPPAPAKIPDRFKRFWPAAGLAVALAAVAGVVYYAGFREAAPFARVTTVTIAVLPFQNLSSDAEQGYFSDGLTEETIAALGRVGAARLRVIARTSSMAYKGTRKTAGQIGTELGASYLVESTVRRDPQRVRITATLIRVNDQVQVWSATYDRARTSFLGVEDEIGNAIAKQVGEELSPTARGRLARRATQDPDAHDLYLRGQYYLNQRTPEFVRKAMESFEAAVQKDPSYANAYSGIAETHVFQTLIIGVNALDQWNKVRLATDKALSLDPNLAEAHTAAGMANFFMGWDWAAAERSFKRAIELNPNDAKAHVYYGHLLSNWLRHDEALAEIQKARQLDPLSPVTYTFVGEYFFQARRYREALPPLQQALAIDPDYFGAHAILGWLYEQTDKPDAAIEEFRKAYRLSGGNLLQLANQGFVLGRTGRRADAQQMVTTMKQISQSRWVSPYLFALVYAGLGDRNETFRWLEKAYEVRDISLVFLTVDPKWDSVRSEERFKQLLRRCRFPV